MPDQVLVGVQGRILTIRLNRPEKKNALTFEMYTGLTEALTKADGDPAVRVVLITGAAGGGGFTVTSSGLEATLVPADVVSVAVKA